MATIEAPVPGYVDWLMAFSTPRGSMARREHLVDGDIDCFNTVTVGLTIIAFGRGAIRSPPAAEASRRECRPSLIRPYLINNLACLWRRKFTRAARGRMRAISLVFRSHIMLYLL